MKETLEYEDVILKIGTRYYDPFGDAGVNYYLVDQPKTARWLLGLMSPEQPPPTDKDIAKWIEREFAPRHCHHTHDCCGCAAFDQGEIVGRDGDYIIVAQSWSLNI